MKKKNYYAIFLLFKYIKLNKYNINIILINKIAKKY